ncbi:hypothetical protein AMS68_002488 [Peltaster fructicola]|uniref:U-box domain-containing protein n=1 Tax=Peltaster fructicola TaxID=286661 RepID=A0A6H0XQP1_9PEZI|nr:hypothetical protein AMS68_002488 [Peltaster fructicola]
MSDADKIRMKRLAKLGGNSNQNTSSTADATSSESASQAPTPLETAPTTPTPAQVAAKNSSLLAQAPQQQPQSSPTQPTQPSKPTTIKVPQRPSSPAKRDRDGQEKPRVTSKPVESLDVWQDKMLRQVFRVTLEAEEVRDSHGHALAFLASTRDDLQESGAQIRLSSDVIESAITEAASKAPDNKPFEYLLACFKRASRAIRATQGSDDSKRDILNETRRLCMSYCVFAITMPEMFGDNVSAGNPLATHMLRDPESDTGICFDFLTEASARFEEDDSIKDAIVGAVEELSGRLATVHMLGEERVYVNGLRNFLRFPKIVDALTQSPIFNPTDIEPQDIETKTLLGPFFRLSPMQLEVATNYFSAPRSRDKSFIANNQNAIRMTLRTHQGELFSIADAIVKAGPAPRGRLLDWFAACVNKNHKKRAMRVDYKTVSSDGFMVNVTTVLDQLCEPFMDARFGKIEKIDHNYLRRSPRVDISDETKINADQKAADEYYAQKADGANNFISEVFFLTVAAHHYGTEAAQTRVATLTKTVQRMEKDLEQIESERHKYLHDARYLARFEEHVNRYKKSIDDNWSTIHATTGVLLDDLNQARSMQFMRYVIVWLLRIASQQNLPSEQLRLPLPEQQHDVFRFLPEYFLEDIVDNFKFITQNIPQIITPQQCEEIVQICITFLRNSEYVKNPGVKSGLVTILFYGVHPYYNHARGVLGDQLLGSAFAHNHLLHALMKYYIEAESTGTHNQFYDKFNIRYEIFQVIKVIWINTIYRENLAKEASANTEFFVQFVNMLVNDVTFVLDESLTSFAKIVDITAELRDWPAGHDPDRLKEREELLEEQKGKAKSYMQLTRETMETLILFTETLADAFTMPEIVTRLADMLDYNLDTMVGPKRMNLKVKNPEEYKFNPRQLLADIMAVYINLAAKDNLVHAIARDGRSYKAENFVKAREYVSILKSPDELRIWDDLARRVAETKAAEEQEEEDLGEIPDEFLDPLLADLMVDPVILPASRVTIDRATIRSHLLSDPNDPFNRMPLKIEEVIPNDELKQKITAWKQETLAAKRAQKADAGNAMDLS